MSNAPLELAKNVEQGKTPLPAYVQKKYDGVPIVFKRVDGKIVCLTRQNETVVSVQHIAEEVAQLPLSEGGCVIAECFIPGKPFKISSGAVRKGVVNKAIRAAIFDGDIYNDPTTSYAMRYYEISAALPVHPAHIWLVSSTMVHRFDTIAEVYIELKQDYPDLEGVMVHDISKPFQPGKRCWGMGRYKPQPTLDLMVHSFEEAHDKHDNPKGMVGRINVLLQEPHESVPRIVGVGPGKLTHKERVEWWENRDEYIGGVIEVKHKDDPTYADLREPTFQRLRKDKYAPDIYERRK